ncbi:SufS subfamily cysteine desulfurase [Pyrodictium delaneyi]|uniref:cysteine desulfurase n=1 Tax=Pyrodictium delaneyi TaxID=1273541 RepID=A0A0N7JD01_9CREN|nr:cysteine desulfurase [Pyrodictium delaneyi]ALL00817.1 SufS subfamily cysteine desulfurase [Pyrodictium delaneyi]
MPGIGFLLDYESIRTDFPIFQEKPGLVYLDNAATTQKPHRVIEAVDRFYWHSNANVARGLYELAVEATRLYEEAHETIARFIGARSPGEIIFTRNASDSANMAAYMLLLNNVIRRGSKIVATVMEHHSNLLPWRTVARLAGARLELAPVRQENGRLDLDVLLSMIDDQTTVVTLTHASNVLGYVNPVREIAREAHRHGALVVVDAAQSTPHMRIDVYSLEADMLFFSGHKMLGPTGIGVLWIRSDHLEEMEPAFQGGGIVKSVRLEDGELKVDFAESPWKFEPGTPHIAGAVGLAEAAKYLAEIGMDKVEAHEKTLLEYALKRLREVPGFQPVSWETQDRLGIVAFNIEGQAPHAVALALGMEGVAVRAGFHCAEPLHRSLGLERGTVRASFYIYNGPEDIDRLAKVLEKLTKTA